MILRHATTADAGLLEYWDTKPHVIASTSEDDFYESWSAELARDVAWREFLIGELNARPIGFIQIIDPFEEETHYWGDVPQNLRAIDIWLGEESDLNKGYGSQMMNLAHERCFSDPDVTSILIDPLARNTRAHRFYERLGYAFQEERDFDGDQCKVYQLTRRVFESTVNQKDRLVT